MAKKKRRSSFRQWLERQMERPAVTETLERMAYSGFVSEIFQAKYPVLFWCLLPPLLIVLLLPMILAAVYVGDTDGHILLLPLYFAWCFTIIPSGLGLLNLCMPLLQKLCEWWLREDFPNGLEKPLYLGHGFTAVFLLGLGGAGALISWLLTLF